MVASFVSLLVAASLSVVANAQVFPTVPAGDTYQAGKTCHIAWQGDKNSTTNWKNMAIELMDGSNLNMSHLTTVATGLDGTVDGTFDHVCPDVTINAPIFFYQFSAPNAGLNNTQWTTRFTIEGADGHLDPAPSSTQPGGAPTPWGEAALVNPATALPAPTFAPDFTGGTVSNTVTSTTDSVVGNSSTSSATQTQTMTTGSGRITTTSSSTPTSTSSSTTTGSTNNKNNGAVGGQFHLAAAVLAASAMGFTILL